MRGQTCTFTPWPSVRSGTRCSHGGACIASTPPCQTASTSQRSSPPTAGAGVAGRTWWRSGSWGRTRGQLHPHPSLPPLLCPNQHDLSDSTYNLPGGQAKYPPPPTTHSHTHILTSSKMSRIKTKPLGKWKWHGFYILCFTLTHPQTHSHTHS